MKIFNNKSTLAAATLLDKQFVEVYNKVSSADQSSVKYRIYTNASLPSVKIPSDITLANGNIAREVIDYKLIYDLPAAITQLSVDLVAVQESIPTSIGTSLLQDSAVTTAKIANNQVTESKLSVAAKDKLNAISIAANFTTAGISKLATKSSIQEGNDLFAVSSAALADTMLGNPFTVPTNAGITLNNQTNARYIVFGDLVILYGSVILASNSWRTDLTFNLNMSANNDVNIRWQNNGFASALPIYVGITQLDESAGNVWWAREFSTSTNLVIRIKQEGSDGFTKGFCFFAIGKATVTFDDD